MFFFFFVETLFLCLLNHVPLRVSSTCLCVLFTRFCFRNFGVLFTGSAVFCCAFFSLTFPFIFFMSFVLRCLLLSLVYYLLVFSFVCLIASLALNSPFLPCLSFLLQYVLFLLSFLCVHLLLGFFSCLMRQEPCNTPANRSNWSCPLQKKKRNLEHEETPGLEPVGPRHPEDTGEATDIDTTSGKQNPLSTT